MDKRCCPEAYLVLVLPGKIMTDKVVFGYAFTLIVGIMWWSLWYSPVGAHLVSRAWVVKKDKKHFAPEMPV